MLFRISAIIYFLKLLSSCVGQPVFILASIWVFNPFASGNCLYMVKTLAYICSDKQPKFRHRRTHSMSTLLGAYLNGQHCHKDKSRLLL